jgi:hypothetical protein
MRRNRRAFPVVLVFLVAMLAAPRALAEPIGGSAGWLAGWWHGAATWIAERLPELARTTAAAGVAASPDDAGSGEEEPAFVATSPDGGTQTESGPHWDPDG